MLQLKRELGTIKKKAIEDAKEILQQAHSKVEQSVKEIRESGAQREVIRSSKQVLKQLGEELQKISIDTHSEVEDVASFEKGDIVRIRDGHEQGEIVEILGKQAIVQCGNARVRIALKDLHKEKKEHKFAQIASSSISTVEATNEIDLRGFFGDEAITQVQTFLDNAYAAGLHRVDIIHGKGTGALRKRIGEFLQGYPHIKSYRLGEWNEGGTGVTVVELT